RQLYDLVGWGCIMTDAPQVLLAYLSRLSPLRVMS
ncbi:MAG: hypothetical protein CFH40_01223, partial [Alphaproteobacteria bacterium MarineAlpha10_Bin3]